MKILFFFIVLITTSAFSQVTDENGNDAKGSGSSTLTGNIGIGVTPLSTSPYKLEVLGKIKSKSAFFNNTIPDGSTFIDYNDRNDKARLIGAGTASTGNLLFNFFDFPESNIDTKATVFFNINDRNDAARFRVVGEASGPGALLLYNKSQSEFFKLHEDGNDNVFLHMPKTNSRIIIAGYNNYLPEHKLVVKDGSAMIEGDILTNSNVGIGVASANIPAGYKLAVAGNIIGEEVKVKLQSAGWPDFVFTKDYHLPSLKAVENYIKEKGHLQDIPSATEVAENGILLGDMNAKLLQKIEELTLYTIQQEKQLEEQATTNQNLESRLLKLEQLLVNNQDPTNKN